MSQAHTELQRHQHLQDALLRDLGEVRAAAERLGFEEVHARATQVFERVAQASFRVAVVGEFKRGKSTLINALLGQEVLPTDVLPCSATLNRITYGETPRVELYLRAGDGRALEVQEVEIGDLAEHITKLSPESERRAQAVHEAVVYYPLEFCRNNVDIIDTPGINDDDAMTRVTHGVLPTVDAALLVILAQSPFSVHEAEFLGQLFTNDLGRVIFVVNRLNDLRNPDDRTRVIELVRDRIQRAIVERAAALHGADTPEFHAFIARIGAPRVFGLSGADALDAKLASNPELLAESGLVEFEQGLERFLTAERGLVTLTMLSEVTASLARRVHQQVVIESGGLMMDKALFDATHEDTRATLDQLRDQLRTQLGEIEASAERLRDDLRAPVRALPTRLTMAAAAVVDAYPLDEAAIGRKNSAATFRAMEAQVTERVRAEARTEAERTQLLIERGAREEAERIVAFGERVAEDLARVELCFAGALPKGPGELDPGLPMGVGAAANAISGGILGGLIGGAMTGYQVAGAMGGLAGGVAGMAVSTSAALVTLMALSYLSLPLTWPVLLPTVVMAGIAGAFGANWATKKVFLPEQLDRFRKECKVIFVTEIDVTTRRRVEEIQASVDQQVDDIFGLLRQQVTDDLGGSIDQTQRTLDELAAQIHSSGAERAARLEALAEVARSMLATEARVNDLRQALAAARAGGAA